MRIHGRRDPRVAIMVVVQVVVLLLNLLLIRVGYCCRLAVVMLTTSLS